MKNINKKLLMLLILIIAMISGINVFAKDYIPLEPSDGQGTPIGTTYSLGTYFPWRYSDKNNPVGYWKADGYFSGYSDQNFMKMVRGEADPYNKIYKPVSFTRALPTSVVTYLNNGGDINNLKIRFKTQDISDAQAKDVHPWTIPEGSILDPNLAFHKQPEYKLDLDKKVIWIRYTPRINLSDAIFYDSRNDRNMRATVYDVDSTYGFNGFSMWTYGGGHRGSATSLGEWDDPIVENRLTKDMILNARGEVRKNTELLNLERSKGGVYTDFLNTNNVTIGYNTFSSGGSIGYFSKQPLLIEFYLDEINNIRIGSEQFKIGDNYNARVIDVDTNKVLDPETDKLFIGKKYRMDYFAGYESTKEDKVKTNNAPILTNFYMYYNGRNSSGPSDLHVPNIRDVNNLPFLEKANKEKETLNSEKWDESKIDVSKIAKYQQEFEIEKIDKHGKKVEKARVCAYLPYQYSFYTEYNGDKSLGDNDVVNDDHACLEFEVDTSEANTLVAHSANGAIVKAGTRQYDRLEIRKYSETGQLINSEICP